jgi:hypothetical protein
MSSAGYPPDDQQNTALQTDWLGNTAEVSLAALIMAMIQAKSPASKQQHKVIDKVLKAL